MCRYAYSQDILIQFFSGSNTPFWTSKFDIMCRYAFLQEMLIWTFKKQFKKQFIFHLNFGQHYFVQFRWNWFSVQYCPSLMLGIAICCIQLSFLEPGVCELAHSFFHWNYSVRGLSNMFYCKAVFCFVVPFEIFWNSWNLLKTDCQNM